MSRILRSEAPVSSPAEDEKRISRILKAPEFSRLLRSQTFSRILKRSGSHDDEDLYMVGTSVTKKAISPGLNLYVKSSLEAINDPLFGQNCFKEHLCKTSPTNGYLLFASSLVCVLGILLRCFCLILIPAMHCLS